MKVSFNGVLLDIGQTPYNPAGWLPGTGIFETIKTVEGRPSAFGKHMQRALTSAALTGVPFPNLELVASSVAVLLMAEPTSNGLLRISFDANGSWGAIHLPHLPTSMAAKVRIHAGAFDVSGASVKSYPYDQRLAVLNEAKLLGFDEAIVINCDGNICEGAVSNIMMQIAGQWVTPATSDGVLPGIIRGLVIEKCGVAITSIPASDIGNVTSAFLLSSLRIAQPIASIDGRQLQVSHAFQEEIHAMAIRNSVD